MSALSLRLREAVAASHDAIERTPLAVAMQAGTLTRADYARLVQQTWRLHAAVEPAIAHGAESFLPLRGLYTPDCARRDALAADLRALDASPQVPPHAGIVAIVARTQRQSWHAPWALAGLLYVLEGSRLGSTVLARTLARGWNVPAQPGVGLDYHLHGLDGRGARWVTFKRVLDALPLSPVQASDVVTTAVRSMEDLRQVYADLTPPVPARTPALTRA